MKGMFSRKSGKQAATNEEVKESEEVKHNSDEWEEVKVSDAQSEEQKDDKTEEIE